MANHKIEVDNIFSNKLGVNYDIYELVTENKDLIKEFETLYFAVLSYFKYLWQSPKSIATILLNCDIDSIKELKHLVVHNIYDNFNNLNNKEEQLIYIIYILLKKEINDLNEPNKDLSNFLEQTKCNYILEEFLTKNEVQCFLKSIIIDAIKPLEEMSYKLYFDFHKIENEIKILEMKNENEEIEDLNIIDKEKYDKFIQKYYYSLKKEDIENILNYKKYDNIKDFLKKKALDCQESPNLYSSNKLLEDLSYYENQNEIWEYYIKCYIEIIEVIDKIFDNLYNNISSIPYSIRCICKLISILLQNKNPNLSKLEKAFFVSKFFFKILLIPILQGTDYKTLLNEYLISDSTYKKMDLIHKILNNLIEGKFFKEDGHYTPFNTYIIEKLSYLIEIFDGINQVELPSFINKLINGKLSNDYEYDYFKENPEENIFFINIYFNIKELYCLIINSEKCKDNISVPSKIMSKFNSNMDILENLINKDKNKKIEKNNDENKGSKKINRYYLYSEGLINENDENILKAKDCEHFIIKELKEINTDEEKKKNDIIKVKNFFYSLLYKYPNLSKNDFELHKFNNIESILQEFKKKSYMNSLLYIDNNSVPYKWYIDSLMEYLHRIPKQFIENDYELLLNELENELIKSIEKMKLEELSIFIEYQRAIQIKIFYYKKVKDIITKININRGIRQYVENVKIPVKIKFVNNKIELLKQKEEELGRSVRNSLKNSFICTINNTIYDFPNIANGKNSKQLEVLEKIKNSGLPRILNRYFEVIRQSLEKDDTNLLKEISIEKKYEKLYDYIMVKLYDKLFPKEQAQKDIDIYNNCIVNNWIEPCNLIQKKANYEIGSFLPDGIKFVDNFVKEKSPRKKILCMKEIYNCIQKLGTFNGEKIEGFDDLMPLLEFTIIKAKPKNFYTNCKYTELFMTNNSGQGANQLTSLIAICESISKINFDSLYNITESEYEENCNLARKGLLFN